MEDSPAYYLIDKLFSSDEKISLRLIPEACEKKNKKITGQNLTATKENFDQVVESIEDKINKSNVFLCVAVYSSLANRTSRCPPFCRAVRLSY